jgi:hypothetical protein
MRFHSDNFCFIKHTSKYQRGRPSLARTAAGQLPAVQAFAGPVSVINVRAIAISLSEDSPRHQNKNENHKERTADSSVSAI